jgi:hypothetical protein
MTEGGWIQLFRVTPAASCVIGNLFWGRVAPPTSRRNVAQDPKQIGVARVLAAAVTRDGAVTAAIGSTLLRSPHQSRAIVPQRPRSVRVPEHPAQTRNVRLQTRLDAVTLTTDIAPTTLDPSLPSTILWVPSLLSLNGCGLLTQ